MPANLDMILTSAVTLLIMGAVTFTVIICHRRLAVYRDVVAVPPSQRQPVWLHACSPVCSCWR